MAKRVRTYSHGMKRQLLFIAALAPSVGVRVLDEPTEGLDPSKRAHMLDLLEQDSSKGTTILGSLLAISALAFAGAHAAFARRVP